jgi:urease accessory protein
VNGPGPDLDLVVARHPWAGTQLVRRRVRWPFALTNPFRLDGAPADMLTIVLQSASGAIVAGDRIAHRIEAGPGAALHVTSQAATAVHAMPVGTWAEDSGELIIRESAFVELLPEPRVLFPRAELCQQLVIDIDRSAVAIAGDGFLVHDPFGQDESFRRLAAETIIRDGTGRVLAVDRVDVSGPAIGRSEWRAHGWLTVLCSPERLDGDTAIAALDSALAPIAGLYAGASALPHAAGIGVRLAARDGEALRLGLQAAWVSARRLLTGAAPPSRRKGGGAVPVLRTPSASGACRTSSP